jgi:hypothetical protein
MNNPPANRRAHLSSSGCTHRYGSISRSFVSLIIRTRGEYRGVRRDRHFSGVAPRNLIRRTNVLLHENQVCPPVVVFR